MKCKSYNECKNENQFKRYWIANNKSRYLYVFCIETEETASGFPDVLTLGLDNATRFYEFKFTQTNKIRFQPTQPAFYKMYPKMNIKVVAYSTLLGMYVMFPVEHLFTAESELSIDRLGTVDLSSMNKYKNSKGTVMHYISRDEYYCVSVFDNEIMVSEILCGREEI